MQRNNPLHPLFKIFSTLCTFALVSFFVIATVGMLGLNLPPHIALLAVATGNIGMLLSSHLRTYFQYNALKAKKLEAVTSMIALFYGVLATYISMRLFGLHTSTLLQLRLDPFIFIQLVPVVVSLLNCSRFCYQPEYENTTPAPRSQPTRPAITPEVLPTHTEDREYFSHPVSSAITTQLMEQLTTDDNYREIRNNLMSSNLEEQNGELDEELLSIRNVNNQ